MVITTKYKCVDCDMEFDKIGDLISHFSKSEWHTSLDFTAEKAYLAHCQACNKRLNRWKNFKDHLRISHAIEVASEETRSEGGGDAGVPVMSAAQARAAAQAAEFKARFKSPIRSSLAPKEER